MFSKLKRDIDTYLERDPAARSRLEVFCFYPGFHAICLHRLAHRLWRNKFYFIARLMSSFSRFFTGIEIHPGATIGQYVFIDHGMGVVIGETACIGDHTTLYHGVTLGGTSQEKEIRHPQVGKSVTIGSGAQLLGPISIGDYAKIGANAVVTKEVKEHQTVVGVPARSIILKGTETFHPYAITNPDESDPNKRDMLLLIERIDALEAQLKTRVTKKKKVAS